MNSVNVSAVRSVRAALFAMFALTSAVAFAGECPANFLHKLQVLEGEMKRMSGRAAEAAATHARAGETARQYGYVHIEGIAAMLESRALVAAGRPADAERAAARADDAFQRWGAASLVRETAASAMKTSSASVI